MKYELPYEEQLGRIKRLHADARQFAIATDSNFEEAVDSFTSFFIQCYHLRDWLIESCFRKEGIDRFVAQSLWLSLCRDIANKQKHKEIKRYKPKHSFVHDAFFGVSTPITRFVDVLGEHRFGINVWEFGMPVDVIEVCDRCVEEWEEFLAHTGTYQRK